MKSRVLIVAVALVILGIGLWAILGTRGAERVDLVPAWQLTPDHAYAGDTLLDPAMSWSPDSKSLLLAARSNKTSISSIFLWKTGETKLDRVGLGYCPNFVDNTSFLYLRQDPVVILQNSLATHKERTVLSDFKSVPFWKDITSFSYLPERKTIALRFSNFTKYCEPGVEEIDMKGKPLGKLPRLTGNGVLDRSADPTNHQVAEVLGDVTLPECQLRISEIGAEDKGKVAADGALGAVVWSPDGKLIAYADANDVKVIDPSGQKKLTVAKLTSNSDAPQPSFICRLAWSPDSRFLAVIQVVPTESAGDMSAYVLDMSKVKL